METTDYLSFISAIVAVIIGFMLSQTTEYVKRVRQSKTQNKAIKKLMELELSKNSVALHAYLNGILKDDGCKKNDKFSAYEFGKRVERAPFPTLSTAVWKTQFEKLPYMYKELELSSLWNYYQSVEEIWLLHEHICQAHNQATASAAINDDIVGMMTYGLSFNNRAKDAASLLYQNIQYVINFKTDA